MRSASEISQLLAFDREHLWHPYTAMADPLPCYPVASAYGSRIQLMDGRELIDGMASWWCAIHGYGHPDLVAALKSQAEVMSHVMFGGLTHEPAVILGQKLIDMTPDELQHVFLADSGSVSVEVAIKMAMQYWYSQGQVGRNRLLTIKGGYHGDTFGCMSVCDPVNGMHHLFQATLAQQLFAERPTSRFDDQFVDSDLDSLRLLIDRHGDEVAAMILEPVVQGAGGMYFYHPDYLKAVRAICDDTGILLIADEIATGFGRTGRLFACEHADVAPDILCVGKALTGGMMTLAATLTNKRVAYGISKGEVPNLMHGPTYMGNPLACAVANASLDIIAAGHWKQQVNTISQQIRQGLSPLVDHPDVAEVRILGAIGVVELKQPVDMARIQAAFVERGVWVRPFGQLIYVMPPYIIDRQDLTHLMTMIVEVITRLYR